MQTCRDIDAWIISTIWQVPNPSLADLVEVEVEPEGISNLPNSGAGLARRGQGNPAAKEFVAYLRSPEGAAIFRKFPPFAIGRGSS